MLHSHNVATRVRGICPRSVQWNIEANALQCCTASVRIARVLRWHLVHYQPQVPCGRPSVPTLCQANQWIRWPVGLARSNLRKASETSENLTAESGVQIEHILHEMLYSQAYATTKGANGANLDHQIRDLDGMGRSNDVAMLNNLRSGNVHLQLEARPNQIRNDPKRKR
jgi:hypothetical protein